MEKNNVEKNLSLTIIINLTLTIAEIIAGLTSGSLSLISDATHNSVDIITMIIAFIGDKVAQKRPNNTHSYGFKRAGIVASIINAVILFAIALFIFVSAIQRLQKPEPIEAFWLIAISLLAVVANGTSAYLTFKGSDQLHIKSVYINMLFDVFASLGALVAGIVIYFTKWYWIDSVVSLMIGGFLLRAAYEIIDESLGIILEAVPKSINLEELRNDILKHECVHKITDLHVWSMTSQDLVLTSVIEINPNCLAHLDQDIEEIKSDIGPRYKIYHQTIEARIQAKAHKD